MDEKDLVEGMREEYTAAAVFQVSTTDAGASGMKLEVLSGTQQVETINLQ